MMFERISADVSALREVVASVPKWLLFASVVTAAVSVALSYLIEHWPL